MAITLAEAKLQSQDRIIAGVIDDFRKQSYLMDNMIFDDSVAPTGGGSLVYGYTYVTTEAAAAVRSLNQDYTPANSAIDRKTVTLIPMGGMFPLDRVVAASNGLVDRVQFEVAQIVKATSALFSDLVINGDVSTDFDGIDASCADGSVVAGSGIDLRSSANMTTNANALIDALNEALGYVPGANAILTSRKGKIKLASIANRLGYMTPSEDAFGRPVSTFAGIPIIDMGAKSGSTTPIVRETDGGATPVGTTDIYVVRLGLDGVHGVSMAGVPMLRVILPDFANTAASVVNGSVELVGAVCVKKADAIAKLEGIPV
jgi:hypothetical protein